MAETAALSREETVGLLLAGAAHVALAWVLVTQRPDPVPVIPPERITVSLAEDVALDSTAPNPSADPAAAMAPDLAPLPEPPAAAPPPPPPPPPPPAVRPTARPTPRVTRTPAPAATQRPAPAPTATRSARPTPAPSPTRSARPTPAPTATGRSQAATPAPAPTATRAGGSRINENFLDGASDATGAQGQAADRPSAAQQASIAAAIIRQLKPHWNPPSGVDVDRLVTVVRFRLNPDGSLDGTPEIVRTTGQNESNRLQVPRHQEQAIRAVRLAAPFDLPERYYSGWRVVTSNFDNRLAQ